MKNSNNKPIREIFVSPKYSKLRIWLVVLLLALGVTLIAVSLTRALVTPPGWATIEGNVQDSCSGDFVFQYLLGASGKAANLEQRDVTQRYNQAAKSAYQIFHESECFTGVNNVCYLNTHVNEAVQVPKALYEAFTLLERYENRALYLAPLYREYIGMFLSDADHVAQMYDPRKNADAQAYFSEVLVFINDEDMIQLELLGDNTVKLNVAEAYLQYAQEKGITTFIDFYWLKNAFIADYLAQEMTAAGYNNGVISSFDGFQRNLDTSNRGYSLNLLDRVGQDVYQAAVLEYSGVPALVSLRNYPTSALAVQQYYQWSDGSYTSCHIDGADGRSKTAVNDLLGYSKTAGCAEILLQMYPLYVADTLDTEALQALDMETVYCSDYVIYASDEVIKLTGLYQKDGISYRINGA